ncbi:MAG TPA: ABC transporter substrate-binding protein, partial [Burkholderiales bacterium]|nr:ABC transporter substrate-binding protein [Burkholderiales bacterium]
MARVIGGFFSGRLFGVFYLCLVCGFASAAELRIGLSADVTTMDPHFVAAQPNLTVQQHVFDG